MMNRRLRERLTEAEILTIFTDVCEGVAAMHNLRPALLHRDLKVENILQASATSFKLCDFGSATSVSSKPPSTTQEIRALEADLNRHTTLQYRAPEMVDPYLRRPIDERSDVWALGVLLYKLCYYTTPFEEHGPLAILNVQYKIPPYPVYSHQMTSLIGSSVSISIQFLISIILLQTASMLREHGTQRPSIFEILAVVHRVRGTKSRFTYSTSEKPLLPPRVLSTNNSLGDQVTVEFQQQSRSPLRNAGIQAREKVLEAIAPMRRGRPARGGPSRSPSPKKGITKEKWLDEEFTSSFGASEGQARKPVSHGSNSGDNIGRESATVSSEAWKVKLPASSNDGWQIKGVPNSTLGDFSPQGFGDSFDIPRFAPSSTPSESIKSDSDPISIRSYSETKGLTASSNFNRLGAPRSLKPKDAFDGLAFSQKPPAPTLGEVRKARTGLAVYVERSSSPRRLSPQPPHEARPSSHNRLSAMHSQSQNLPIEERFPSIEELNRRVFASGNASPLLDIPPPKTSYPGAVSMEDRNIPTISPSLVMRGVTGGLRSTTDSFKVSAGPRSQNVTGTAMQESKKSISKRQEEPSSSFTLLAEPQSSSVSQPPKSSLTRKHRSYIVTKQTRTQPDIASTTSAPTESSSQLLAVASPSRVRDWLTGDDDDHTANVISRIDTNAATTTQGGGNEHGAPVLRESPSKRASFFEKSPHLIHEPLEGDVEQGDLLPPVVLPPRPSSSATRSKASSSATGSRNPPALVDTGSTFKTVGLSDNWSPITKEVERMKLFQASDSEDDEGPEDVDGYRSLQGKDRRHVDQEEKKDKSTGKPKRRQSSVHDLVDLWGGSGTAAKERGSKHDSRSKEEKRESSILSSSMNGAITPYKGVPESSSSQQISASSQVLVERFQVHSPSQGHGRHMKESTAADAKVLSPLPLSHKSTSSTSSLPSQPRNRPQSMFVFPSTKSTIDSSGLPSPGLSVPPEGMRTISASRRTSISDMVQRFEGLGATSDLAPLTPVKPIALKLQTDDNQAGLGSSNTRYMKISPANSPAKATVSFESMSFPEGIHNGLQRTSPVELPDKTPQRLSPVEDSWKKSATVATTNSGPGPTTMKPTGLDDSSLNADPKSPVPERPYTGISKLIDQWQKKAEESNTSEGRRSGGIAKRYGVAYGGAR
jgi:AP2-associated kinase